MSKKIYVFLFMSFSMLFAQEMLLKEKSIKDGVLANGFKYSIVKNSKPKDDAEIRLYVGAGSLDEAENQRGLAHFIEHMAFNGIKHFKKNELISYLESIGMVFGGDLNANTGYERTVYMLSLPLKGDNLNKALTVIRDWTDGLNFDAKEYDKERDIILEERRLRDTVNKRLSDQYLKLFYGNTLYSERDPIGLVDVIKNSKVEIAKSFYDTWYRPELMHLVIVGDIDVNEVEKIIQEKMSSIKSKSKVQQVKRVAQDMDKTTILSVTDKELTANSVNIFYTSNIEPMRTVSNKKDILKKTIIEILINLRVQEQMLRDNPKAMEMITFQDTVSKNRSVRGFVATYKKGNGLGALEELYSFMSSFKNYGFSLENFTLAKKLIVENVEKSHDRLKDMQSKNIASILIESIENNSTYIDYEYDYNLTKKLLNEITLEDINKKYVDIVNIKNRIILFKDISAKKFNDKEVLDTLNKANDEAKDLSKVLKVSSSIIDDNLTSSKFVSKAFNKELGLYSYVLENNISVDFKPNSKNKNLLELQAFSEGGFSILKDEELKDSKNTTNIVMQSAPAKWTDIELKKIMTGKQADVSLSIERFGEKITASCNTKDMETMFELLYARVTKPKVDKRVLENMKIILSNNLKQLSNNPQFIFAKDVIESYYYNNPEIKFMTLDDLVNLKANAILKLYEDRFSDLNNFHFVIVGDAKVEQIEKLISKYLANLPVKNRVENHSTTAYAHPKGDVVITKYYNTENKANVSVQYTGKVLFDVKNNLKSMIASNILSIRLRNLIREEKSGVYGISVNAELVHELKDEVLTTIKFVCDPKRKDELLSSIYSAIDKFLKDGVSDDELKKLKKMIHLEYKTQIDKNAFWVEGIMASRRFNTPLNNIIEFPNIIDSITVDDIKTISNSLFSKDRLVSVLMPKKDENKK